MSDDPKTRRRQPSSTDQPKRPTQPENGSGSDLTDEKVDQRVVRSRWNKDRTKRLVAMTEAMPKFIDAYYGNEIVIASAMSVAVGDVAEVISKSDDLRSLQEIAQNSREAKLLDRGMYLAETADTMAPVRYMLETLFPDKYLKARKAAGAAVKTGGGVGPPSGGPVKMENSLKPTDKKLGRG